MAETRTSVGTGGGERLPELEGTTRLKRFLHHDLVGSGFLLAASLAAMIVVNFGGAEWYHDFWHIELGFAYQDRAVDKTLHHWVNDGLMAIFFFVVGLEIKRELLAGELASLRKAMLPAAAAVGGMSFPALTYTLFNFNGEGAHGWGVPMATDIAFAAGCLALLKKWINPALMVFLVALAIVDDLGSVGVIAVFYTETIETRPLMVGATLIILSFVMGQFGVRSMWPYLILGVVIWIEFVESGIHATVAGVLLALSIPHTARYRTENFTKRMRELLGRFDEAEKLWPEHDRKRIQDVIVNSRQQSLLRRMEDEVQHVEAPLQRLEHNLEPIVVFVILPIFAFANAGVHIEWGEILHTLREPVTMGAGFGLVLGKPIGIVLASWLMVKTGLAELPRGVRWSHIAGVGFLAGIGFTMSLFINELAFIHSSPEVAERLMTDGKIGIVLGSVTSATIGLIWLRLACRNDERPAAAPAAH